MSNLPIIEYPDAKLRQCSSPIVLFDAALQSLASDMLDTALAADCLGLSAPQCGVMQQLMVVRSDEAMSLDNVYINPRILQRSGYAYVQESCLSLPGVVANVLRSTRIRMAAQDVTGQLIERDVTGMEAVCVQHEIDHLQGVLFTDRMAWFERIRLRVGGINIEHAPLPGV